MRTAFFYCIGKLFPDYKPEKYNSTVILNK